MALTTVQAYRRELEEFITIEIDRILEIMANGHINSFDEYKNLAGKIAGLRTAVDLMREAEKSLAEKYR